MDSTPIARHIRTPFMDPLVLAIAAGEKTVTRRMIRPQPSPEMVTVKPHGAGWRWSSAPFRTGDVFPGAAHPEATATWTDGESTYLRARPGDIMDVCEALVKVCTEDADWTVYRADGANAACGWPWKVKTLPARYCPSWAVRHRRTLVSVRPERLSDVTDAEAVAEGIVRLGWPATRDGFLAGFRKLHGLDADADPWVERREWAVSA